MRNRHAENFGCRAAICRSIELRRGGIRAPSAASAGTMGAIRRGRTETEFAREKLAVQAVWCGVCSSLSLSAGRCLPAVDRNRIFRFSSHPTDQRSFPAVRSECGHVECALPYWQAGNLPATAIFPPMGQEATCSHVILRRRGTGSPVRPKRTECSCLREWLGDVCDGVCPTAVRLFDGRPERWS